MSVQLHHGDCLEFMRTLPAGSVDAVVTDPPYGLRFMGKHWDYDVPSVEIWRECLRVLKPGGHLLSFAGTRTQHRMAVRIEDAGFEIRDMIAWVYGSGFPKSLDVSKAIDKAAGAEREVVGPNKWAERGGFVQANTYGTPSRPDETAPATDAAREWQGWGTALKPALEPITVARKPLEGTVAANVMQWGTGAINVDGARVGVSDEDPNHRKPSVPFDKEGGSVMLGAMGGRPTPNLPPAGRWPANLIHDGSDEVVGLFPQTQPSNAAMRGNLADIRGNKYNDAQTHITNSNTMRGHDDNGGSAARFFYCAKASKRDRDDGLEGMEAKSKAEREGRNQFKNGNALNGSGKLINGNGITNPARNHHPTVKPTELMRYLCRLVTPPAGIVFDPFAGSGSTGRGAVLEGFSFIGCEIDAGYFEIARKRIEAAQMQPALIGGAS